MSALDDAIKEHLELKRKHGAAEEEVRELEAEALGPPRSTLPPVEAEPERTETDLDPAAARQFLDNLPPPEAQPPLGDPSPLDEETLERPSPLLDPPPPAPPASSQETVDFTPDFAADDEHDVLEDTPEFLDDAPEHDRLWFEQRPPRDFDFDD